METPNSTVSLKLLVDTKSKRVLFAEAGKEFVDFLFSLMCLPLGTVVKILSKTEMVGSVGDIYRSIETLGDTYLQPKFDRDFLLKPRALPTGAATPLLLANDDESTHKKGYACPNNCKRYSLAQGAKCPDCNRDMSKEVTYVQPTAQSASQEGSSTFGEGGFVKGVVSYMITDDLQVKPLSTISSITLLNKFNVKELADLEEQMISVGMNEGLKLLKESLQSKTVLTNVFLKDEISMEKEEKEASKKVPF